MRRVECGACESYLLRSFLDLGSSPIADAYTASPTEASQLYPLELATCETCGLVQLMEIVDHKVLFGTGYSFYSSASSPLSDYQRHYAQEVLAGHMTEAQHLTVEVGCNDGDLLRHFSEAGCRVLGVDPATGPVNAARERGLDVIEEPFGRKVAEYIREEHGQAGVIIANHVLAHVESVSDVLDGVQHLLAEQGTAYIEVQYLPDLLVNNAFDLVYHEHRNFFSLASLQNAVERWGLHVVDAKLTDRQGGSLRVAVQAQPSPFATTTRKIYESEEWLEDINVYGGFQGRINRVRDRLQDIISDAPGAGVLGYGAPAKATTLLNFCGLTQWEIPVVVDTTKAKQGRYIPGTGIPIHPLSDINMDNYAATLLLAWNYAPQIIRQHLTYMRLGGHWIVPIPSPIVL